MNVNKVLIMDIKLLSYNIQSWDITERRIKGIFDLIKRHNPDVICLQEVTVSWFSLLKKELSNVYGFTGRDRFHGDHIALRRDRERNCVLYKKERFELVENHTYWLGPDIYHPSKFEESVFNRIFTATTLFDKVNKQKVQCISTHFDYLLPEVREEQAMVLANYLNKQKGYILLAGDFNGEPKEKGYSIISKVLCDVGHEFNEDSITYHAYDKFPHEKIDYIFRSQNIKVKQFTLVKDEYEGLPPSDHYPVECIVSYESI